MVSKEAGGSRRWCESRQQTQLSGRETAPDTREAATSIIIETSPRQCSFYLRRSTQVYKWHRKSGQNGKEGPKSSEMEKEGS